MPVPVSDDADAHIFARLRIRQTIRMGSVDRHVCRLDGQFSTVRHGVAPVDRQVEDRVLELMRIAEDRPEVRAL